MNSLGLVGRLSVFFLLISIQIVGLKRSQAGVGGDSEGPKSAVCEFALQGTNTRVIISNETGSSPSFSLDGVADGVIRKLAEIGDLERVVSYLAQALGIEELDVKLQIRIVEPPEERSADSTALRRELVREGLKPTQIVLTIPNSESVDGIPNQLRQVLAEMVVAQALYRKLSERPGWREDSWFALTAPSVEVVEGAGDMNEVLKAFARTRNSWVLKAEERLFQLVVTAVAENALEDIPVEGEPGEEVQSRFQSMVGDSAKTYWLAYSRLEGKAATASDFARYKEEWEGSSSPFAAERQRLSIEGAIKVLQGKIDDGHLDKEVQGLFDKARGFVDAGVVGVVNLGSGAEPFRYGGVSDRGYWLVSEPGAEGGNPVLGFFGSGSGMADVELDLGSGLVDVAVSPSGKVLVYTDGYKLYRKGDGMGEEAPEMPEGALPGQWRIFAVSDEGDVVLGSKAWHSVYLYRGDGFERIGERPENESLAAFDGARLFHVSHDRPENVPELRFDSQAETPWGQAAATLSGLAVGEGTVALLGSRSGQPSTLYTLRHESGEWFEGPAPSISAAQAAAISGDWGHYAFYGDELRVIDLKSGGVVLTFDPGSSDHFGPGKLLGGIRFNSSGDQLQFLWRKRESGSVSAVTLSIPERD